MTSIDLQHAHSLSPEQARLAVEDVATKLEHKFGLASRWEGDTLHITRPGVDGRIALQPRQLHVNVSLKGLLSAMKGPIQAKLEQYLGEHFT